jgi:eukaryotic-like serine/threonine-protein kinase
MAETWRGEWAKGPRAGEPVAVKKMLPSLARDPAMVEMFVEEARVSVALDHPNLARVFAMGVEDGRPWLAMELVEGLGLDEVLRRSKERGLWHLPVPVAAWVAIEVARALHHAHTRAGDDGVPLGIVHRDVSPDNVVVGLDGVSKLLDFGVAKSQHAGRKETAPGLVKGKYLYFSPEQSRAEALDGRSDVYALGVVLYRLVCGELPFSGAAPIVLRKINEGDYRRPLVVNPALPEALAAAVVRALAVKREDRFPSARELEVALMEVLARVAPDAGPQWVQAYVEWLEDDDAPFPEPMSRWRPKPTERAAEEVAQPPATPAPPPSPSRWAAAVALLALTALGAGAVAWLALAPKLEPPPPAAPPEPVPITSAPPPIASLDAPDENTVPDVQALIPAPRKSPVAASEKVAPEPRVRSCASIISIGDTHNTMERAPRVVLPLRMSSGSDLLIWDSGRDAGAQTRLRDLRYALQRCIEKGGTIETPAATPVSGLHSWQGPLTGDLIARAKVRVR